MAAPEANLFISCVTDEFGSYRPLLRADLGRPGVRIETQEQFLAAGEPTLVMLDDYVRTCHAVIHLAGDRTGGEATGGVASEANRKAILALHEDLPARLDLPDDFIQTLSYTQ